MKNRTKLGLALLLFGFAFACKQANKLENSSAEAAADSTSVEKTISSNAAVEKK